LLKCHEIGNSLGKKREISAEPVSAGEINVPLVHVSVVEGSEEAGRHVKASPVAGRALVCDLSFLYVAVLGVGNCEPLTAVATAIAVGTAMKVLGSVERHDLVIVVVPL